MPTRQKASAAKRPAKRVAAQTQPKRSVRTGHLRELKPTLAEEVIERLRDHWLQQRCYHSDEQMSSDSSPEISFRSMTANDTENLLFPDGYQTTIVEFEDRNIANYARPEDLESYNYFSLHDIATYLSDRQKSRLQRYLDGNPGHSLRINISNGDSTTFIHVPDHSMRIRMRSRAFVDLDCEVVDMGP